VNRPIYRYRFGDDVSLDDAKGSLLLSVMAIEALYGRSAVRLDAAFCFDKKRRVCVVDAGAKIGRAIALVFTTFLTREFGEEAFRVEHVGDRREADLLAELRR
jgi:hypothetical protein